MQTFLKVTNIENRKDKNGRAFQMVTFSEVKYFNDREVKSGNIRNRNLWSPTDEIKGDNLFNQLSVGDLVSGSIQSFNTTAFEIDGRTVNRTTVVVFDYENPVTVANNFLRRNGACVVNQHGEATVNLTAVKTPVPAVAGDEDSEF